MAGNPYWDKLVLGLHCDGTNGSTTFTEVKGKAVTAYGNAQISTAQYPALTGKTSSGYLDGTGDYLTSPASSEFNFGAGDFTVRARVRISSFSGVNHIVNVWSPTGVAGDCAWLFYVASSTQVGLHFRDVDGTTYHSQNFTVSTLSTNTWYHIEVTRSGSSFRCFINGTQEGGTITNSATMRSPTTIFTVGSLTAVPNYLTGYVSEIEVYKGVALHTSGFTLSGDPFEDGYLPSASGVISALGNVPYFSSGATLRPVIFVNA